MTPSAHVDTFARDNLPPKEHWPEFVFESPEFQFPERINCASLLVDNKLGDGRADRIAIRNHEGQCTYLQLVAQANRIANVLVEDMGLKPGNRVLIPSPNGPMMAACMLAVWKAGGVAVPAMPLLRARELSHVMRKARISHALADRRLSVEVEAARASCPHLTQVRYYHDDGPQSLDYLAASKSPEFTNVDTAGDDVALIIFTSGTSGIPKGAMHFHRDLLSVCEGFPRYILGQTAEDVLAGTPSMAFTYGLVGIFLVPMYYGASTVLLEQYSAQTLLETVERFRVSLLYSVPTMYRAMTTHASEHDLSSLRACVSAGEHLPVPTRAAWERATNIRLVDGIGSTEMCQIFISAAGDAIRPGATGKPVPGYRAAVLDDAGNPVPTGTIGRLAVKGPTGCRYLADERQTSYVQNGWNVTGDAYLVDEDGYFFYQARIDDMIVSAGYNIAAPEVESALLAHPAVQECGVIGWPDPERGQVVKAFVVLELGYQRTAAMATELQEHVKHTIAPYKYPRLVEFADELPRTGTGKLQRFKLRPPTSPAAALPASERKQDSQSTTGEGAQAPRRTGAAS